MSIVASVVRKWEGGLGFELEGEIEGDFGFDGEAGGLEVHFTPARRMKARDATRSMAATSVDCKVISMTPSEVKE